MFLDEPLTAAEGRQIATSETTAHALSTAPGSRTASRRTFPGWTSLHDRAQPGLVTPTAISARRLNRSRGSRPRTRLVFRVKLETRKATRRCSTTPQGSPSGVDREIFPGRVGRGVGRHSGARHRLGLSRHRRRTGRPGQSHRAREIFGHRAPPMKFDRDFLTSGTGQVCWSAPCCSWACSPCAGSTASARTSLPTRQTAPSPSCRRRSLREGIAVREAAGAADSAVPGGAPTAPSSRRLPRALPLFIVGRAARNSGGTCGAVCALRPAHSLRDRRRTRIQPLGHAGHRSRHRGRLARWTAGRPGRSRSPRPRLRSTAPANGWRSRANGKLSGARRTRTTAPNSPCRVSRWTASSTSAPVAGASATAPPDCVARSSRPTTTAS
jgi:hypothetical protein